MTFEVLISTIVVGLVVLFILENAATTQSFIVFKKSGYIAGPYDRYVADIKKNKNMFVQKQSFTQVRRKIPWIDSVAYWDMIKLGHSGELNTKNIKSSLFA